MVVCCLCLISVLMSSYRWKVIGKLSDDISFNTSIVGEMRVFFVMAMSRTSDVLHDRL